MTTGGELEAGGGGVGLDSVGHFAPAKGAFGVRSISCQSATPEEFGRGLVAQPANSRQIAPGRN